jgi:hypothetical protein
VVVTAALSRDDPVMRQPVAALRRMARTQIACAASYGVLALFRLFVLTRVGDHVDVGVTALMPAMAGLFAALGLFTRRHLRRIAGEPGAG